MVCVWNYPLVPRLFPFQNVKSQKWIPKVAQLQCLLGSRSYRVSSAYDLQSLCFWLGISAWKKLVHFPMRRLGIKIKPGYTRGLTALSTLDVGHPELLNPMVDGDGGGCISGRSKWVLDLRDLVFFPQFPNAFAFSFHWFKSGCPGSSFY